MATERQIAANRMNSARSTGPRTDEGKARSRANATTHGLAGSSASVEAGLSPEFADRRARWEPLYRPEGEDGAWALDQAVASSLRIERCGRSLDALAVMERERARLAWDQDRSVEAATVAGRLARDPALASSQLQATLAGVRLLLEGWFALSQPLEAGLDWSEVEESRALDLLGVALEDRAGLTRIDPFDGSDAVAFRNTLLAEEVARLEALRDDVMVPLDAMHRQFTAAGDLALLSKPAKLMLRYEREAWRRHREAIKELQKPETTPSPVAPLLPPTSAPTLPARVVERPRGAARNEPNLVAPSREGRRTPLDQGSKIPANDAVCAVPLEELDDEAWVEAILRGEGRPAPERSQSANFAVGRA
jgi:hypothetical protein